MPISKEFLDSLPPKLPKQETCAIPYGNNAQYAVTKNIMLDFFKAITAFKSGDIHELSILMKNIQRNDLTSRCHDIVLSSIYENKYNIKELIGLVSLYIMLMSNSDDRAEGASHISGIISHCEKVMATMDFGDKHILLSTKLEELYSLYSNETTVPYVAPHHVAGILCAGTESNILDKVVNEDCSTDATKAYVRSDVHPDPVKGFNNIVSVNMNDYFKYFYEYRNDSNYILNGLKLLVLFARQLKNALTEDNVKIFIESIKMITEEVRDNRTAIIELKSVLGKIINEYEEPNTYMIEDMQSINIIVNTLKEISTSLDEDNATTESILHECGLGFYYDIFPPNMSEEDEDMLMETFIEKMNDCDQDELYDTILENVIKDIYDRHKSIADQKAQDRYERRKAMKDGKSDNVLDKVNRSTMTNKYAYQAKRCLKKAVVDAAAGAIGGPVFAALLHINRNVGKKANEKERTQYVQAVRSELEILEHKIDKARSSGNDREFQNLVRAKTKLSALYTAANFRFDRRIMA